MSDDNIQGTGLPTEDTQPEVSTEGEVAEGQVDSKESTDTEAAAGLDGQPLE